MNETRIAALLMYLGELQRLHANGYTCVREISDCVGTIEAEFDKGESIKAKEVTLDAREVAEFRKVIEFMDGVARPVLPKSVTTLGDVTKEELLDELKRRQDITCFDVTQHCERATISFRNTITMGKAEYDVKNPSTIFVVGE